MWLVRTFGLVASGVLALGSVPAAAHCIGRNAVAPEPLQKKAPPPRFAPFVGSLDDARRHATERNVALVVCAVLAGEEASERFAQTVPQDPAYAAALAGALVIVANAGEHPAKKLEELVDGKKVVRDVCSAFFTPTCADHQKLWDPTFFAFQEQGELRCPQMIVVAPDGQVAKRLAPGDVPKPSQVTTALGAIAEKFGPGLSEQEFATVQRALVDAEAATNRGAHADAWRACALVVSIAPKAPQAEVARKGQATALGELAVRRDAALERLAGDRPTDGYDELVALVEDCKGLPNEKELAKLVADAEAKPTLRDVIAAHKKHLAAEALWKEIGELEAANQKRKAEAKIRLLVRKYWDTEAGKRARKQYPEIAADEDAKGR